MVAVRVTGGGAGLAGWSAPRVSCSCCIALSATTNSCSPAGEADGAVARSNSFDPQRRLSPWICWLTADWVRNRSCAARVMLMRRPTATKPRKSSIDGIWQAELTFLSLM